jgi:hypothetical protein
MSRFCAPELVRMNLRNESKYSKNRKNLISFSYLSTERQGYLKISSLIPAALSGESWTIVVHFNNSTYYVWVDSEQRAWVTQITLRKADQSLLLDWALH